MSRRSRNVLIQIGGVALAILLLYLALRGADLSEIWSAFVEADYRWLAPVLIVLILSHVLRAWRWQILLEALPPTEINGRRPQLRPAFCSIMIGYMVNYAAPRLGELARTANMASREKISFTGVLGTVVAERALDVLMLLLGLVSVLFLLADRLGVLHDLLYAPFTGMNAWLAFGVITAVIVVAGLLFVTFRHLLQSRPDLPLLRWTSRLRPLYESFRDGFVTVLRSRQRGLIAGITLVMWGMYVIAAYIPFQMLHMAGPYGISLVDTWSIMILGSLGVVVPSPGGIGSFHYITVETLV
ncbi:MAG: lysylphosphatidylglycerol synthase transmembrane domain-containing protein, partial [Rhodothermales bacterium]